MPLRCRRMNYRKKYFNFYLNVITLKFVHVKTRQLTDFLSNVFSHVIMILQLGEENMKGHNSPWSNVFIKML